MEIIVKKQFAVRGCASCPYRGIDGGPGSCPTCNHPAAADSYSACWVDAFPDKCPLLLENVAKEALKQSGEDPENHITEFDAGCGTTPDMWEMVSDLLDGEKLPGSLNTAIYLLRRGAAIVLHTNRNG